MLDQDPWPEPEAEGIELSARPRLVMRLRQAWQTLRSRIGLPAVDGKALKPDREVQSEGDQHE